MIHIRRAIVTMVLGSVLLARAEGPSVALAATAAIAFDGSSTLHAFAGSGTTDRVSIQLRGTGTGTIWTASGDLAATNLATGNTSRDTKMYTMLSAPLWPDIHAEISGTNAAHIAATACVVRVAIAGWTNDVEARIEKAERRADGFSATLAVPLSLASFKLKPPSVLGLIRVADAVAVRCQIESRPASSP